MKRVYVVERNFGGVVSDADLEATMERLGPCLEEYGLEWITSYLAQDRTRMTCIYAAPDAESVRAANRSARVPFDRIWRADVVTPPPVGGAPAPSPH